MANFTTMITYQTKQWENGLTGIVHTDDSSPLVAINTLYIVGSKDENASMTGITHLFEHLMFSGSKHIVDFDEVIQNAGGENNAFTNSDITNFYNILPKENVEIGLWLEADRMQNLKLTTKSLNTQKKVVIEEFKETCLNEPYGDMWHHMSDMCFENHGYKWPTIGAKIDHVEKVNLAHAQEFYESYYCPSNAIIVICGPITTDEGFALIEKWFAHIPRMKEKPTPLYTTEDSASPIPYQAKAIKAEVPSNAIYLGFKMQHRLHPDYYIADLISDILSSGRSSRFYQRLIKEKKIFSYIDAFISGNTDHGLLVIDGKIADGYTIDQGRDAIWEELNFLTTSLMEDRELEKIKNKAVNHLTFSEVGILNKAMSLAYFAYLGHLELINLEIHEYEKITSDDICRVAKTLFNKHGHAELVYTRLSE
jgi:zinc protease